MASSWVAGREATSAVDQTYGQRSVFGAMGQSTAPADDELDVENDQEALDYLQLVRAEAGKIPHVMIAPRHGPQAFPPQMTTVEPAGKAKRRRRRRHWDEQDDGQSAKKRRVSGQKAVPVELSYDDDDGQANEPELAYDEGEVDENDGRSRYDNDEDDEPPQPVYPDRSIYQNDAGDARGYYQDGAYTAAPDPASGEESGGHPPDGLAAGNAATGDVAFSAAYRARLLVHFAALRALLQQDPPAAAVAALPADHDTEVGALSTRSSTFRHWLHLLRTTDPLPVQVAAMDKISAFRLLRVLQRGLLAGSATSSRSSRAGRFARGLGLYSRASGSGLAMDARTSRWLWALLARLPERGELDYREVGYIRDVAKQAVLRLAHLSYDVSGVGTEAQADEAEEGEAEEGEAEEGEAEEGELTGEADGKAEDDSPPEREDGAAAQNSANGTNDGNYEQAEDDEEAAMDIAMDIESEPELEAKAQTERTAAADPAGPDKDSDSEHDSVMQQRATLEMVLAVAGEFYGQRDLLAFRSPWQTTPSC